jgi:hypothetical protein
MMLPVAKTRVAESDLRSHPCKLSPFFEIEPSRMFFCSQEFAMAAS